MLPDLETLSENGNLPAERRFNAILKSFNLAMDISSEGPAGADWGVKIRPIKNKIAKEQTTTVKCRGTTHGHARF